MIGQFFRKFTAHSGALYAALFFFALASTVSLQSSEAFEIPLPGLDDIVSPALRSEAIRAVGVATAHRPFQPATPLGVALGLEAGLEFTLIKVPETLFEELEKMGLEGSFEVPTLPIPRLQLHKGLGPKLDVGLSYVGYQKYRLYGADVKLVVYHPEEGPAFALRLSYTQSKLDYVYTTSWSPQVVMSKELHFATPYMGLEYQVISGKIEGSQEVLPGISVPIKFDGIHSTGGSAFLGLGLRVPALGFKISVEGAYSFVGAHSLGAKLGLAW